MLDKFQLAVQTIRKERNILQMLNKSTIFCKLGFQNVLFSGVCLAMCGESKAAAVRSAKKDGEPSVAEHALCNLVKGTALRVLGKLDEDRTCLEFGRLKILFLKTNLACSIVS
uniref:Uncharacterized protein n=1 Tax=Physcomitrium patens TaxID=3218 RepID=A0A7I4DVE8_PHYPA